MTFKKSQFIWEKLLKKDLYLYISILFQEDLKLLLKTVFM